MAEDIVQLTGAEFDEGLEFLNFVFGEHRPHDFAAMLPSIYRPTDEHMSCNYAIRRDGAIKAIVGLFPLLWHVGDRQLRVSGIGGVSAHPETRGQGLMQRLMKHCVEVMKERGDDASFLGGQRQRYLYFGYEKCGNQLSYTVNRSNIRHCYGEEDPQIRLEPFDRDDDGLIGSAKTLHDGQLIHCERPRADFKHYLVSWHHKPWIALDETDEMVGYMVTDEKGTVALELVATSTDHALRMVRAWVSREGGAGEMTVKTSPIADGLSRELARVCESVVVVPTANWQVFEWTSIVEGLMLAKRQAATLCDGRAILEIDGYGAIELAVHGGEPTCAKADAARAADVQCDAATAMRLLFGPLRPSQEMTLSPQASVLESWCPLPLTWTQQDGV